MEFIAHGSDKEVIQSAHELRELVEKYGFKLDVSGEIHRWPKSKNGREPASVCYHFRVIALTPGLEGGKSLLNKAKKLPGVYVVCPKCSKIPMGEEGRLSATF
jgi:hypothetical protein